VGNRVDDDGEVIKVVNDHVRIWMQDPSPMVGRLPDRPAKRGLADCLYGLTNRLSDLPEARGISFSCQRIDPSEVVLGERIEVYSSGHTVHY
jgi:hypothetical protein